MISERSISSMYFLLSPFNDIDEQLYLLMNDNFFLFLNNVPFSLLPAGGTASTCVLSFVTSACLSLGLLSPRLAMLYHSYLFV